MARCAAACSESRSRTPIRSRPPSSERNRTPAPRAQSSSSSRPDESDRMRVHAGSAGERGDRLCHAQPRGAAARVEVVAAVEIGDRPLELAREHSRDQAELRGGVLGARPAAVEDERAFGGEPGDGRSALTVLGQSVELDHGQGCELGPLADQFDRGPKPSQVPVVTSAVIAADQEHDLVLLLQPRGGRGVHVQHPVVPCLRIREWASPRARQPALGGGRDAGLDRSDQRGRGVATHRQLQVLDPEGELVAHRRSRRRDQPEVERLGKGVEFLERPQRLERDHRPQAFLAATAVVVRSGPFPAHAQRRPHQVVFDDRLQLLHSRQLSTLVDDLESATPPERVEHRVCAVLEQPAVALGAGDVEARDLGSDGTRRGGEDRAAEQRPHQVAVEVAGVGLERDQRPVGPLGDLSHRTAGADVVLVECRPDRSVESRDIDQILDLGVSQQRREGVEPGAEEGRDPTVGAAGWRRRRRASQLDQISQRLRRCPVAGHVEGPQHRLDLGNPVDQRLVHRGIDLERTAADHGRDQGQDHGDVRSRRLWKGAADEDLVRFVAELSGELKLVWLRAHRVNRHPHLFSSPPAA